VFDLQPTDAHTRIGLSTRNVAALAITPPTYAPAPYVVLSDRPVTHEHHATVMIATFSERNEQQNHCNLVVRDQRTPIAPSNCDDHGIGHAHVSPILPFEHRLDLNLWFHAPQATPNLLERVRFILLQDRINLIAKRCIVVETGLDPLRSPS
jgi:hypothetical protein